MNSADSNPSDFTDRGHVGSELSATEWDAYRYVLREMSVQERQRFEDRLADDQAAREALTEAMQLCGDIELLESFVDPRDILIAESESSDDRMLKPKPVSASRWRAATWVSLSASICLILAWWATEWWQSSNHGSRSVAIDDRESVDVDDPALAVAWVQMHNLRVAEEESDDPDWDQLVPGDEDWLAETLINNEVTSPDATAAQQYRDVTDDDTGSWMLVALSGLEELPDEEEGELNREKLQ